MSAPAFYPGSIERTSFAEKDEKKGYLILAFEPDGSAGGKLSQWKFQHPPARPMIQIGVHPANMKPAELKAWIITTTETIPADSILELKVHGKLSQAAMEVLKAANLRTLAPATMNVSVAFTDYYGYPP